MDCRNLIEKLDAEKQLAFTEWVTLLNSYSECDRLFAAEKARTITQKHYGRKVFIRGIVEFSNICGNDCFYCGIRKSNKLVRRYNMSDELIVECCRSGWQNNIKTFVLQSGEAAKLNTQRIGGLVRKLKSEFPGCAVTLSLGELSFEEYDFLRRSGADRYLLRHETADENHYRKMHPECMSLADRMECLYNLKKLGFQTGCGIMTGSPFQTPETLAKDMIFMHKLQPEMVGIGPFVPHKDTPFASYPAGRVEQTLMLLSLCRIMLEKVLLPATTALGSLVPGGRKQGILAGGNVIMPNLTPQDVQKDYLLYNTKSVADKPVADAVKSLSEELQSIGCAFEFSRGDLGEKVC